MKTIGFWLILALTVTTAGFYACKKPGNDNGGTTQSTFDKTAMLTNYADALIIPGYTAMQQKLVALKNASDAFTAMPNVTSQSAVKFAFRDAYLQYERIAPFQFGPAETALLDIFMNYSGGIDYSFSTSGELTGFSVDTVAIENNISSGTYNLTGVSRSNLYSQGFPALGYLCCAPNAISKMGTNTVNRTKYISDVVNRMISLVDGVAANWTTYRAGFIENTKTNVGSPIGNIVNQLAYQLDMLKGPRIGWPLGKQSSGIVFADKCEAYYARISLALAIENLSAIKNMYTGGTAGKGMSDYLISLKKESLNTDVLAQFDLAKAKLEVLTDPLSVAFTAQSADVEAAYREIQKLLTLLKTDVASATAVQITFTDNDGD